MRIAILGAGRVGRTLGARWSTTGHDIVYGVRDPSDIRYAELGSTARPTDAVLGAEVILVALPWSAVEAVLSGIDVADAVVIDATNPLAANARELQVHPELSGAHLVAQWARSSHVIKAFNTTGAGNMADPSYAASAHLMLLAGDDADAKSVVSTLASEIGFDAVDAGTLSAARDLEHLAMIWIRLAYSLGHGPDIAFALVRR
jgi:8-hydroxy-5-deazaflavin:NADPH oxidoreductase